jgi:hypothetical protein
MYVWSLQVHCNVHKIQPHDPILSQLSAVLALIPPYFSKLKFRTARLSYACNMYSSLQPQLNFLIILDEKYAYKLWSSTAAGSGPAEDGGFSWVIKSVARTSFGGEVKPSVPCRTFTACTRDALSARFPDPCFSPVILLLRYQMALVAKSG